jgi:solute carrier family 25 phosphate transporter 3
MYSQLASVAKTNPYGLPTLRVPAAGPASSPHSSPLSLANFSAAAGKAPIGPVDFSQYDLTYYLKGAVAGGVCCSFTHGALCPVDVVKTRIQLDPITYNQGLIGGMKKVVAEEGAGALATGLGPTVVGYFVQGWFKFGGVEFFKINLTKHYGEEFAWNNKTPIYLASAAMAEFIADIFLCPLEATRIRLVADPTFADGLAGGAARLLKEEGAIKGFYSGFGPILFKQVPYTMAKFAVQGSAAEMIESSMGIESGTGGMKVALSSGTIAGVAAAIISHPADTLLSKVNKAGAGGEGSIMTRLGRIAAEIGFVKLATVGLGARCVMIGSLTALQFAIFDIVMEATGAVKIKFHMPASMVEK